MRYKWIAYSSDTAYEDKSKKTFPTIKECYDDMRDAVLAKMKWNTEYDEDFETPDDTLCPDDICDAISYKVWFEKRMIAHKSYSGTYVYLIVEEDRDPSYYDVFNEGMAEHLWSIDMIDFNELIEVNNRRERHDNCK